MDEHSRDGLLEKLERDAEAGPRQLAIVERLLDFYGSKGLLPGGNAEPLYCVCEARGECWRGLDDARPAPDEAEIAVPWIGPGYFESGICAVAINMNKYGPLGGNWWIARGHIDRLNNGTRRNFEYRVGQYLAAVGAAREGRSLDPGSLDTQAAASGWEDCAFMEAVKCSPERGVSKPTRAMWTNCPPRYLEEELKVLEPRVVLAIGQGDVWPKVRKLLAAQYSEEAKGFARGTGTLNDKPVEVFFVNHPAHQHWKASLPSLRQSLSHTPSGAGVSDPA